MEQRLVVGVDMAKNDFVATSRVGEAIIELGKFTNVAASYGLLHAALACACVKQGLSQIHLSIEATGGYEAALVAYAYENQW